MTLWVTAVVVAISPGFGDLPCVHRCGVDTRFIMLEVRVHFQIQGTSGLVCDACFDLCDNSV